MMPRSIYYLLIFCTLQKVTGAEEIIVCEGDSMFLSCDSYEVITILEANFGRTSPTVCTIEQNITATCQSTSALATMQRICENKPYCSVMASSGVFGDQCLDVTRYLCAVFLCVNKDSTISIINETAVETSKTKSGSTFNFTDSMLFNRTITNVDTTSSRIDNVFTSFTTKPRSTGVVSKFTGPTSIHVSKATDISTNNVLVTSTTDGVVESVGSTSETVKDNFVKTCTCRCNIRDITRSHDVVKEALVGNFTQILAVNRTSLSSNIRKLTSARDKRASATIVGYTGVIILVLVLLILIVFDFVNYIKKRN